MSWIARHKEKARKIVDIFSDNRISPAQLANEAYGQLNTESKQNVFDWVEHLKILDDLGEPDQYNEDGTLKMSLFLDTPVKDEYL